MVHDCIYKIKIHISLYAVWGERKKVQGEIVTYRVTCPLQTHESESLRVGTRNLDDSDVQPGLAPMIYSMLTPQDNIKVNAEVKLRYNLYQVT